MKIKQIISNNMYILGYSRKYVPGFLGWYTFYTVFVAFVEVLMGSISLKFLFDALSEQKSVYEILGFLLLVSIVIIIRNLFGSYIVEYLYPTRMITLQEKLGAEIFEQALKMDIAYYETPKFYTDFVWAASQADQQFGMVLGTYLQLTARISDIIFLGGMMLILDPALMIFALLAVAVRLIFNTHIVKKRFEMKDAAKPAERERDYSQRIFYLSDYAKEIRLTTVHKILYGQFERAAHQIMEIYRKGGRRLAGLSICSGTLQEIFLSFIMIVYLAYQVMVTGRLSIGDFAALIYTVERFARRLRNLVDVVTRFGENSLYIEKIKNFFACQPEIEHHKGQMPKVLTQEITLENVSFTYQGEDAPSLKNINMTIHPNEKIAIVGYNGAGKSTLIKLLLRLYDVSEGKITVGGEDIKEYDTEEYRKNFGAVFQDFQIFAATLGENVVMDFTKEKDADNIAHALDKGGYERRRVSWQAEISTPLTKEFYDEGKNLSGGESQKVAIARSFYRPFRYIIMDEPSSALDPISEYNLNHNMLELAKDKTVIFISHRLSTTCMADRIFMLEKGEIIEEGTHAELMKLDGKYAQMFHKQAGKYVV